MTFNCLGIQIKKKVSVSKVPHQLGGPPEHYSLVSSISHSSISQHHFQGGFRGFHTVRALSRQFSSGSPAVPKYSHCPEIPSSVRDPRLRLLFVVPFNFNFCATADYPRHLARFEHGCARDEMRRCTF